MLAVGMILLCTERCPRTKNVAFKEIRIELYAIVCN